MSSVHGASPLSPHKRLVDKCTPRDKYGRTDVHLKSSFLQSSDDSSVNTPISPWVYTYNSRQRSQSSADTQGWKHLPTPVRPTFRLRDNALLVTADNASAYTNSFKVLHHTLHNLDFDATCLDRLDDQLLLSPTESFVDVCYSEAVHDNITVPVPQPIQPYIRKGMWLHDRTAALGEDPFHDRDENYFMKSRKAFKEPMTPSALPKLGESSLPGRSRHQESMLADLESRLLYHKPNESVHFYPVPTQRRSEDSQKSSLEAFSVRPVGSSGKFRRFSNAVSGRSRMKSPV